MTAKAMVISLRRTPERLAWFRRTNAASSELFTVVEAIDGLDMQGCITKSRMISTSAREYWTPGALGAALSHLHCWRQCIKGGKPMLIVEDDVALACDWQEQLKELNKRLHDGWDMILLGWNYNSLLRRKDASGIEQISLFEPAYPDAKQIQAILNSKLDRKLLRLQHAFGLPGYLLSPSGAEELINKVLPLEMRPLNMGRGIPVVNISGIDGCLNLHYPRLNCWVVDPPLAVALNDPKQSNTLRAMSYGESTVQKI